MVWCVVAFLGVNLQKHLGDAALIRWGLIPDEQIYHGAYWGLITNALVHQEPLHILFNLSWFWILGGAFERTFGPLRMALFILVTAFVSSGLQLFDGPGIGLSGVGYALFGFGWVGRRRFPEFAKTVNDRTVQMFVFWGLLCVFLTYSKVMRIGNVAHLTGALLGGALAGLIVQPRLRLALSAAIVLMTCGSVAVLFWNPRSLYWVADRADAARDRGDYATAISLYKRTLDLDANPAWTWESLARVYGESHMQPEFKFAVEQLRQYDPADANRYERVYGTSPDAKPE